MAVTRSMARRFQAAPTPRYQASDYERAAAAMRGQNARTQYWISQLQQHRQTFARRKWPRYYKDSDITKRHRKSDTQPKTERVTSYTRRI